MPTDTDIARRNRALIAFALLSGVRDDALASLSLKHVDLARRQVFQDARTVRTKKRKTITSWFFPVGEDIEAIVAEWIGHLVSELHYGPDDPLFPSTRMALDADRKFAPAGLERRHWKNADAIRRIFRDAFAAAGLPSFNPHSFRRTLALYGETICRSPEAFKAWSQNLGHEHVLTTFTSYGAISSHRQADILQELRTPGGGTSGSDPDPAEAYRLLDQILKKASRG
jgi:integrase